MINNVLGNWEQSVICFSKAIKLNPAYADAHYNLGIALDSLERLEEAILSYTKAIELKPNYPKFYEGLIRLLTFYNPEKPNLNPCVIANKLLQTINYSYVSNKQISDDDVVTFFQRCNNIILENINNFNVNETEIFRSNTVDLKCERHFKVFNTFNAIPEYCFGCYKVQIGLRNVMELFKLYFVFDKLNLKNNNPRKCMLEMRPEVSGDYKGYIYCFSLSEANEIQNQLTTILNKKINENISITVKRGCSEYGIAYPQYKKINKNNGQLMKYNEEWRSKEKFIDDKLAKRDQSKHRVLRKNLPGATVCDILTMSNWLVYAKIMGDLSYKKIIKKIPISPVIEKKVYDLLSKRKKDLSPSPD
jgi:tetratricopeptide (TPR) repeat protein